MASDSSGGSNHSSHSVSFSLQPPTLVYNPPENISDIMLKSLINEAGMTESCNSNCEVASASRTQEDSATVLPQSSPMDIDEIINSRKRPPPDRDVDQDSPFISPRRNLLRLFPHHQTRRDHNNNRVKAVGHIAKVCKSQPRCLYCGGNKHEAGTESSCSRVEGDKCINCKGNHLATSKECDDTRDVTLADKEGKKLTSNGKGEIVIKQNLNNDRIRLKNVLCVPDININLLSVAKITDHGNKVEFNKYGAIVYRNKDEIKMTAVRKENAYYVKSSVIKNEQAARTSEIDIWHKRFGHTNKKINEEMKKEDLVIGLKETDKMISQCESCVEGKMCRKAHPRLTHRKTKKIMELWHIDLVGPINPSSYGGKRYIFTIIDDYSRVIFIDFLKEKKEASEKLKKLILLKENQTGMKLKGIRSDNGGEFVGKDLEEWFSQKGIKHELSPAKTPQCNGVVERANKSIIEMTRTMMTDSKMPLVFWAEAACTAVHIKNRSKTTVHGKTPYEIWNGRRPNVKYMRRFGCVAYLLNKDTRRKKFDPRAIKGIFIGYATNNTYRVYIPEQGKVKADCDVRFDETRNGCELLNTEKSKKLEKDELIVIGLEYKDEEKTREEEGIEENEENTRTEDDCSEYEDAVVGDSSDNENEDITTENKDNETEIQPMEKKNRGRPQGTTKAMIEARKQQTRDEQREEGEYKNL
ncbi:POLX protein, partial [Pseudoatta argentina]